MTAMKFNMMLCVTAFALAKSLASTNDTNATASKLLKKKLKLDGSIPTYICNNSNVDYQYDINCLNWIWTAVGCTSEGRSYPDTMSTQEQQTYFKSSLKFTTQRFESIRLGSFAGMPEAQRDCFGFELPRDCQDYYGPFTRECLEVLWEQAGCLFTGELAPLRFSDSQLQYFDSLTLGQAREVMQGYQNRPTVTQQLACYGFRFPNGCIAYQGPHNISCIQSSWIEAGCTREGRNYPTMGSVSNYNDLNLNNLFQLFRLVINSTEAYSKQAQVDCFGIEFIDGCNSYRGPHSRLCLNQLWKGAGCSLLGTQQPDELNEDQFAIVASQSLREFETYIRNLKQNADYNQRDAQLACYGFEFPLNCDTFSGPNDLECYHTIWKRIGCLEFGYKYPDRLSPQEIGDLKTKNLQEFIDYSENFVSQSESGIIQAQLDCYGLEFGDSCNSYGGHHSLDCLIELWQLFGCLFEGARVLELDTLADRNMWEIRNYSESFQTDADFGNRDSQRACYGFEYPENCKIYAGPHTISCYRTIWINVGCLSVSFDNLRIVSSEELNNWDKRDLKNITTYMRNLYDSSYAGDKQAQLRCFGTTLTDHCVRPVGPFTTECLEELWSNAGCLADGRLNPSRVSGIFHEMFSNTTLRQVKQEYRGLANGTNLQAQLDCFDYAFPANCISYYGYNPVECYITYFNEVGCQRQGFEFPLKLTPSKLDTLNTMNLSDVDEFYLNQRTKAMQGDVQAQLDCYGLALPEQCETYNPPHDLACYASVWKYAGCFEEGQRSPSKLKSNELQFLEVFDIEDLIRDVQVIQEKTRHGDVAAQLNCYGFEFGDGCTKFDGPHTVPCYQYHFEKAGCTPDGYAWPDDRLDVDELNYLDELDLIQLRKHMNEFYENAYELDIDSQLECYGRRLPFECNNLHGPHSLQCIISLWLDTGCHAEGLGFPGTAAEDEVLQLRAADLRLTEIHFEELLVNTNIQAQFDCFGFSFPNGCSSYYPPHSSQCRQALWNSVGCLDAGYLSPKRNSTLYSTTGIDLFTITALRDFYRNVLYNATVSDVQAQLDCFGQVFPLHCPTFYGPHSERCLHSLWITNGCFEQGLGIPSLDAEDRNDALSQMSLTNYTLYVRQVAAAALRGHSQSQMDCYGRGLPPNCTLNGTHIDVCLNDLWSRVGCLGNFTSNPSFSTTDLLSLRNQSIFNVIDFMERIVYNASGFVVEAQVACFGQVLPDGCAGFFGPHSLQCLDTLWLRAGCSVQGLNSPRYLDKAALATLSAVNITQLQLQFSALTNLNKTQAALDCYGFEFPDNCTTYGPPLSLLCAQSEWNQSTCSNTSDLYPSTLVVLQNSPYASYNLLEFRQFLQRITDEAVAGDPQAQLDCYAQIYTNGCISSNPPFSMQCLLTMFIAAGCSEGGYANPYNVSAFQLSDLNNLTMMQVQANYQALAANSSLNNATAQQSCYGRQFPAGCTTYNGPHNQSCFQSAWLQSGCSRGGLLSPYSTQSYFASIMTLNISRLLEYFERIYFNAISVNAQAQADCFGFVLPQGCVDVAAPHGIRCMQNVWIRSGCTVNGQSYPRLSAYTPAEYQNMAQLTLNEMIVLFQSFSQASGTQAQIDCYGFAFGPLCPNYTSSHTLACLQDIFRSSGCLSTGSLYPRDLSIFYANQTLLQLKELFDSMFYNATIEVPIAQINCYGEKLADGCLIFEGPFTISCLHNIWTEKGCIIDGNQYPANDSRASDVMNRFHYEDAKLYVRNFMDDAKSGDVAAQLACYGIEFPDGCSTYEGPNDIVCYQTMWKSARCILTGNNYPKSGTEDTEYFDTLNLRELSIYFENVFLDASYDPETQLACFGLVFPSSCTSYYISHNRECVMSIWKWAGCLDEGYDSPALYTEAEHADIANRNIEETLVQFQQLASGTDMDSQLRCYGIPFPNDCSQYYGSHNESCLRSIIRSAGCVDEGEVFKTQLTSVYIAMQAQKNIREVTALYNTIFTDAVTGDIQAQMDCFGFIFPENCTTYGGPHSLGCLLATWIRAGCIEEGFAYINYEYLIMRPLGVLYNTTRRLYVTAVGGNHEAQLECFGLTGWRPVTIHPSVNFINLELLEIMKLSYLQASVDKTARAQMDCYGTILPDGCGGFDGPFNTQCLNSLWNEGGCIKSGYGHPSNLLENDLNALSLMSLLDIRQKVASLSTNMDTQARYQCYGQDFPDSCTAFYPPHSRSCLNAIWKNAGCLEDGSLYQSFTKSTIPQNIFTDFDLSNLILYAERLVKNASLQVDAQLNCYGTILPSRCDYRGPFSLVCLHTVWMSSGCLEEGYRHPANMSQVERLNINLMNLREVGNYFAGIRHDASTDTMLQLECYGLIFPKDCMRYIGPHSAECIRNIWINAGCVEDRLRLPANTNAVMLEYLQGLNLRKVMNLTQNVQREAATSEGQSQIQCFGRTLPVGCNTPEGPFSRTCLNNIWFNAGCLEEGIHQPKDYTEAEIEEFSNMNLADLELAFQQMADYPNEVDQLNCFGSKFPTGCLQYRGPHDLECYQEIWRLRGCIAEGYLYPTDPSGLGGLSYYTYNLRQLKFYVDDIVDNAITANTQAQQDCYGTTFPRACSSYWGPHGTTCAQSMWREVGCTQGGHGIPLNDTSSLAIILNALNIREALSHLKAIREQTSLGNKQAQLDCYGIEFPPACIHYNKPHSLECYENLWRRSGCADNGTDYPANLADRNYELFNSDLRTMTAKLDELFLRSTFSDQSAQISCFGIIFPEDCRYYSGPHSSECLSTLWKKSGCLEEGEGSPLKAAGDILKNLKSMSIPKLIEYLNGTHNLALTGNADVQRKCYGLEFPSNCKSYEGPHSKDCLSAIWLKTGCLDMGNRYPNNLSFAELTKHVNSNLRSVIEVIKATYNIASKGNWQSQLECFGQIFPQVCASYQGPHSTDCLRVLWLESGCAKDGNKYPTQLKISAKDHLNKMNLWNIRKQFNTLTKASNYQNQLDCYGIDFPLGCTTFFGPLTLKCYQTVWKTAGCTADGNAYPEEKSIIENPNELNLREWKNFVEAMISDAVRADTQAQVDCYGISFPGRCIGYWGPHSKDCLSDIWLDRGCKDEGTYYPKKLSSVETDSIFNLNLKDVQEFITNMEKSAKTDGTAQMNCFGMVFPSGCDSYDGPHSPQCYDSLWTETSCTKNGVAFPANLPQQQIDSLDGLNLRIVREQFQTIFRNAYSMDQDAQVDCYGIALPLHCRTYYGPHSLQCLDTLWWQSGCLEEGKTRPKDFENDRLEFLNKMDIGQVTEYFQTSVRIPSNVQNQVDCYGMEFPTGCQRYNGPHALACVQSTWKSSGCTKKGLKYPTDLASVQTNAIYNVNLRDLKSEIQSILETARHGDKQAQLDCLGMVFPDSCVVHDGIQPLACQQLIWSESGCLDGGSAFPTAKSEFSALNVNQIQGVIQEIKFAAEQGHESSQVECFGFQFPSGCSSYDGPHAYACYRSVWKKIGCQDQGFTAPNQLSDEELNTLGHLNLRDVMMHMENTYNKAISPNIPAQLACFGRELPSGCVNVEGPYSSDCLASVWLKQGCLNDGEGFPDNLNDEETDYLNQFNITKLEEYFQELTNISSQEKQMWCYGFKFPKGCDTFGGPHTLDCYKSIWTDVGCVQKGFFYAPDPTLILADALENLNLKDLSMYIKDIVQQAIADDVQAQLGCFGIAFPENCRSYKGPHALPCLQSIWKNSNCIEEGDKHPSDEHFEHTKVMMNLDLSELLTYTKSLAVNSRDNNATAQMACYGIDFPDECAAYIGQNSIECYNAIWESVGCEKEGHGSPHRPHSENIAFLNELNLRQIIKYMGNTHKKASKKDEKAQQDCFGRTLPLGCESMKGPHTYQCIDSLWLDSGCFEEGLRFPSKDENRKTLDKYSKNIRLKAKDIEMEFTRLTIEPTVKDQLDCYGFSFPDGCSELRGSANDRDCFVNIWNNTGCVEDGEMYPGNLAASVLKELQQLSLIEYEKLVKALAIDVVNSQTQMDCYGLVFPGNCTSYEHGHSLNCLQSLWKKAGCVAEGGSYPGALSSSQQSNLQQSTLKDVQNFMEDLYELSISGNEEAQMECYGLPFVSDCRSYNGPHSQTCYQNIWLSVGCINPNYEWLKILNNVNPTKNLNIRELKAHMENTYIKSTMLDREAQRDCFDMEFPEGCSYYKGPHSDECLHNLWVTSGCRIDGLKYPAKANKTTKLNFNAMNLRELEDDVARLRLLHTVQSQMDCFGFEFPRSCDSFEPPHSLNCFESIWEDAGCLKGGSIFPMTSDVLENAEFNSLNLLDLKRTLQSIVNSAISSNQQAQMDCFGIIFPRGCTHYHGVHSFKCVSNMWRELGCVEEGTAYPKKLPRKIITELYKKNLLELRSYILNIVNLALDGKHAESQMLCYGITFPQNCRAYFGPHTLSCYEEIWSNIGCLDEGHDHPHVLSSKELSLLDTLNLREIISSMKNTYDKAHLLNVQAQLDCFGIVLPQGCDSYSGPHNVLCLSTIWLELGCTSEGRQYPTSTSDDSNAVLLMMPINEIRAYMQEFQTMTDIDKQLDCYGFVFPIECLSYTPPHSLPCYQELWIANGCIESGSEYPNSDADLLSLLWHNVTLREARMYIKVLVDGAELSDQDSQRKCYGIVFPATCENYNGPHSRACQKSLWTSARCSNEGFDIFINSGKTLGNLNLRDIKSNLDILQRNALSGDQEAQMTCYGLQLPPNCVVYDGPKSILCYMALWLKAGCLAQGEDIPLNMTQTELDTIDGLNIREVLRHMTNTFNKAEVGDVRAQRECFGFEFSPGCLTFSGPHDLMCFVNLWLEVGCLPEGRLYPKNLSSPLVLSSQSWNLVELRASIAAASVTRDDEVELDCYGFRFPVGCVAYEGPHSLICLDSIWLDYGCKRTGLGFPEKLTFQKHTYFSHFTIGECMNYVKELELQSSMGNTQAQLDCFGSIFPAGCNSFTGPHSLQCLIIIWEEAGCVKEGARHPKHLNNQDAQNVNKMNLWDLAIYAKNIYSGALNGDRLSQTFCFGLEFPAFCTKYEGVQQMGCYNGIWRSFGCTTPAWGRPFEEAVEHLETLNLREIYAALRNMMTRVPSDPQVQLSCYGMKFPNYCENYYGPHALDCLKSIFVASLCVEEGYPYLENMPNDEVVYLMELTIIDVGYYFSNISKKAQNGDLLSQEKCYGLRLPPECPNYFGPNPIACYNTMWLTARCLKDGLGWPELLSPSKIYYLESRNFREVRGFMNNLYAMALSSNTQAQLDCFGLVFPLGCRLYDGSHSLQCINSVWKSAGCLKDGLSYPGKLSSERLSGIAKISLKKVFEYVERIVASAEKGSKTDAVHCYGIEFPSHCTTYEGPHSSNCLATLWKQVGCTEKGLEYPLNPGSKFAQLLYTLDLREILASLADFVAASLGPDPTKQKECFGLDFLDGCDKYEGPHPMNCYESAWYKVGCLSEGRKHPSKLNSTMKSVLDKLNLHDIVSYFERIIHNATAGMNDAQMDCFGLEFRDDCPTFYPPLTDQCLDRLWTEVAECSTDGAAYPKHLESLSLDDKWKILNQKEAVDAMEAIKKNVREENKLHIYDCFGVVLPEECDSYFQNLSLDCLRKVWLDSGCNLDGHKEPGKLTSEALVSYKSMSFKDVLDRVRAFHKLAQLSNEASEQIDCYGRELPPNCDGFNPPLSHGCLVGIWEDTGCLTDGGLSPLKLDGDIVSDIWGKYNLTEALNDINRTAYAATMHKTLPKYECFGEIPAKCIEDGSRLPDECLQSIWVDSGCVEEGEAYPLREDPYDVWNTLTLRQAVALAKSTFTRAMKGDIEMQLDCFGVVFPDYCYFFWGPYEQECLLSVWIDSGCMEEGYLYLRYTLPGKYELLHDMDLGRVLYHVSNAQELSGEDKPTAQHVCYGFAFPDGCQTYDAPHVIECFRGIWFQEGCVAEGILYPKNRTVAVDGSLTDLDLRELIEKIRKLQLNANLLVQQAQIDCYGLYFPDGCITYNRPFPDECAQSIASRFNLTEQIASSVAIKAAANASSNLRDLIDRIRQISDGLREQYDDVADITSCMYAFPPLDLDCLTDLWINGSRCSVYGLGYPGSLSAEERQLQWGNVTLVDAFLTIREIKENAESGDEDSQRECYGLVLPPYCDTFGPPLSRRCVNMIWSDDVGCDVKGTRYPGSLPEDEYQMFWGGRTLQRVRMDILRLKNQSFNLDGRAYMECFGRDLPLWIYGITATAIKSVMFTLGTLLLLAAAFALFRLIANYPRGKTKKKALARPDEDATSVFDIYKAY